MPIIKANAQPIEDVSGISGDDGFVFLKAGSIGAGDAEADLHPPEILLIKRLRDWLVQEGLELSTGPNPVRVVGAPADSWAVPYSILGQFASTQTETVPNGAPAGSTHKRRISYTPTPRLDAAGLGISRTTGRTMFTNIPNDSATALRLTGRLNVFFSSLPAGRVRVLHEEYMASTLTDTVVLADFAIDAVSARTVRQIALADSAIHVRGDRGYDTLLEYTPDTALTSAGSFGADDGVDDADIIAYRRYNEVEQLPALGDNIITNAVSLSPYTTGGSYTQVATLPIRLEAGAAYWITISDSEYTPQAQTHNLIMDDARGEFAHVRVGQRVLTPAPVTFSTQEVVFDLRNPPTGNTQVWMASRNRLSPNNLSISGLRRVR